MLSTQRWCFVRGCIYNLVKKIIYNLETEHAENKRGEKLSCVGTENIENLNIITHAREESSAVASHLQAMLNR